MWTKKEFVSEIRSKYPGSYQNWSDDELFTAITEKHPAYKSQIKPDSPGFLGSAITAIKEKVAPVIAPIAKFTAEAMTPSDPHLGMPASKPKSKLHAEKPKPQPDDFSKAMERTDRFMATLFGIEEFNPFSQFTALVSGKYPSELLSGTDAEGLKRYRKKMTAEHPLAYTAGAAPSTILSLVAAHQAFAPLGIKAATGMGRLPFLSPGAQKMAEIGVATAATRIPTFASQAALTEATRQRREGKFEPGKLAKETGKGALWGTALSVMGFIPETTPRVLTAGGIGGGYTLLERKIEKGKLSEKDYIDAAATAAILMGFELMGAETTTRIRKAAIQKAWQSEITMNRMLARGYTEEEAKKVIAADETIRYLGRKGLQFIKEQNPNMTPAQLRSWDENWIRLNRSLVDNPDNKALYQQLEEIATNVKDKSLMREVDGMITELHKASPRTTTMYKSMFTPAPAPIPEIPTAPLAPVPGPVEMKWKGKDVKLKNPLVVENVQDLKTVREGEQKAKQAGYDGVVAVNPKGEILDIMQFKAPEKPPAEPAKPELRPYRMAYMKTPPAPDVKGHYQIGQNEDVIEIYPDSKEGVAFTKQHEHGHRIWASIDPNLQGKFQNLMMDHGGLLVEDHALFGGLIAGMNIDKPIVKERIMKESFAQNYARFITAPSEFEKKAPEVFKFFKAEIQPQLGRAAKPAVNAPVPAGYVEANASVTPFETGSAVETLGKEITKKIGETPQPGGLAIRKVGVTPQADVIKLPPDIAKKISKIKELKGKRAVEIIKFDNPEIEKQYQAAKGITKETIGQKLKQIVGGLWQSATRAYPHLPQKAEFAEIKNTLNKQQAAREVAREDTLRILQGITYDLGENQLDLFSRKILLDDLAYDLSLNKEVPFGLTAENFQAEKTKIDKIIEANPVIFNALALRKQIHNAVKRDLIALDILDEDQAKNPNYFRHQVLEYARAKGLYGVGRKLKTPSPGYAKRRMGTTLAINTDYFEAEFEYLAQALYDIKTAQNLRAIENSPLNIKKKLQQRAREKGVDWHELIPEGYDTWQPREGRVFYTNQSIPERLIDKIADGVAPKELLQRVLAVGRKRKELVLPVEVAETLDNLYTGDRGGIAKQVLDFITKTPITWWKRWVLFNPRRLLMYNYQNQLGDLDAVIAANPTALKYFPRAWTELWDHFYGKKPMTKDMHDFFERGGLSAGLTLAELPEVKGAVLELKGFEKKSLAEQANLIKRWFAFATKASTFRENLLRYTLYLDYLQRYETGDFKSSWLLKYGASNPADVDALASPKDKAAKVATEAIGDYANITALGKELRTRLIPFFSWLEINAKRYPLMLRNAFVEGKAKGVSTTGRVGALASVQVARALSRWFMRAVFLWATFQTWNHLRYPDVEEELGEYDRRRMHLTLGRTKNGRPMILRGQGALGDFLEWFGMDEAPHLTRLLMEDKISLAELGWEIAKAPANKFLRGISPSYKIPIEYVAGVSLFPDVFEPRAVRDKIRNILQNVQAEDLYDWITGKPQRPLSEILLKMTPVVTSDPEENAYWEIQNLKRLYLEKQGKGKFAGGMYTPRSESLYQYKKALKFGDKEKVLKYRKQLIMMGITGEEMQNSLKSMNPLAGLDRKEKAEFVGRYLNARDRDKLKKAMVFYSKVITGRVEAK
jgi:hypothetical protein